MHTIHRFSALGSTMTKAAELARAGAAHGTVVIADQQTAGQGRLSREWHSEAGVGLYLTEILRPALDPQNLPVVTLALGLAAAEDISQTTQEACDLRWPNDVLIGARKCAGILAVLEQGALLAGIGVNVNNESFPAGIAAIATSLRIATGREHSREDLTGALLEAIDRWMDVLAREGREPVLRAFANASSYASGRRVVVEQAGETLEGVTDGLDAQGFLWLRRDDGQRNLILAGGVRPACC